MRTLKTVGLYALCLVLIGAACPGEIYHMRPFGYGAALALSAYFHPLPLYIGLVGFEMLTEPSLYTLAEACVFAAVMIAVCLVRKKRPFPVWWLFAAAAAGSLGRAYSAAAGATSAFSEILSVCFTGLTGLVGLSALKPLVVYRLKYRLLEPELASLGLLAAIYGLSLSAHTFYGFNPAVSVVIALSAVCAYCAGAGAATVTAVCFGLGMSLNGFNAGYLAACALSAAVLSFFAAAPRILCGLSGVLGFVMAAYLFDSFGAAAPMLALSAAVGALVFVLVPVKSLRILSAAVTGGRKPALRYLINRTRYTLAAELDDTAVIFSEMGGVISETEPVRPARPGAALRCAVCDGCEGRKTCKVSDEAAETFMRDVLRAGRASVGDLPAEFSDNCPRLAAVIGTADELQRTYAEADRRRAAGAEVRRLIGEHYAGISELLKDMGRRTAVMIGAETAAEEKITEELTYRNVVCGETLLAGEGDDMTVTMVVRADSVDEAVIEKVLYKILGRAFSLRTGESGLGGFSIVYATVRPKYDVLFAAAVRPKSDKSGDTHSFTRIGKRFMMALSDGMGSGEKAYKTSETAIGLVENFYKAGFPDDLIVKSINKFLSLGADETFSAVDIAVIDLESGDADVIKIGTPPAYIKNDDTVSVVRGAALPLGIVDEIRPTVVRKRLAVGETVVFVSDGVSDCFEGDALADYINSLPSHNPQAIADAVLTHAAEAGRRADDMTVVCARVLAKP